jgi:hypothetical protein
MPGNTQRDGDLPRRGLPYIRFFVSTDGVLSVAALSYLRSILRIAPVRLVLMSGELEGPWISLARLLATPMDEPMIANVVCTHPQLWTRALSVPMPKTETAAAGRATGTIELHTAGVHNVLLCAEAPTSKAERDAAAKYEAIVVPSLELAKTLYEETGRMPVVVHAPPVRDHVTLRSAILP